MPMTQAKPKWKRFCWFVVRVYAAICTLLVTALIIWSIFFPKPAEPTQPTTIQATFLASYGTYMAKEYPERRNYFWSMAAALREYVAEAPVLEADLFKYLGKPDQYYVTNEIVSKPSQSPVTNKIVLFAFVFDRPGVTNRWSATAVIAEGKVQDIGFNDANLIQGLGFQAYPADSAPNRQ